MQGWSFAGLGHLVIEYEGTGHQGHDEKEKQYHPLSLIEPTYRERLGLVLKIKLYQKNITHCTKTP